MHSYSNVLCSNIVFDLILAYFLSALLKASKDGCLLASMHHSVYIYVHVGAKYIQFHVQLCDNMHV